MPDINDILTIASKHPVNPDEMEVLQEKDKQIPGTWQYSFKRYHKLPHWIVEDSGMLSYHYQPEDENSRYLELQFCISGNTWCHRKDEACELCRASGHQHCDTSLQAMDVLSFRFEPAHLANLIKGQIKKGSGNDLLNFSRNRSFSRAIPVNGKIRTALETLLTNDYSDTLENIFINAQTQILLLYSLEGIMGEKEQEDEIPACKFLTNDADRDKIIRAREILLEHIGDPITIKELSRKVAINECYLKKGFKVMFGSTIFDFYQDQRMEHARYLLYEKGKSVSEVSALLGYSSISHFSTAFKKHTGLKPCELLMR